MSEVAFLADGVVLYVVTDLDPEALARRVVDRYLAENQHLHSGGFMWRDLPSIPSRYWTAAGAKFTISPTVVALDPNEELLAPEESVLPGPVARASEREDESE